MLLLKAFVSHILISLLIFLSSFAQVQDYTPGGFATQKWLEQTAKPKTTEPWMAIIGASSVTRVAAGPYYHASAMGLLGKAFL